MGTTHDTILRDLEKKLQHPGRVVLTEHEFRLDGQHEADILVLDNDRRYAYAIEVKTALGQKARQKGLEQLTADKKYLQKRHHIDRVFTFLAYKFGQNYKTRRVRM